MPYTRVFEHKQLSGQDFHTTTISKEFPNRKENLFILFQMKEIKSYIIIIKVKLINYRILFFAEGSAGYQYFNMDQVVADSLKKFTNLF